MRHYARRSWVRLPSTSTDFKILIALAGASLVCIYMVSLSADDPLKKLKNKALQYPGNNMLKNVQGGVQQGGVQGDVQHGPKLLVIILAQFRTGSTLIGEIFNKNPDIFYLFEPLSILDCIKRKRGVVLFDDVKHVVTNLLQNFSHCEFPADSASCIGNTSVSVTHSKNVGRVCKLVTGVDGLTCPIAHPGFYRNECLRSRKAVAMTITRAGLKDLETVVRTATKSNLEVRILHLVRDPRATANSRRLFLLGADGRRHVEQANVERPRNLPIRSLEDMGLFESKLRPAKARSADLCLRMKINLRIAIKQPKWLHGRYKLLRYEDFIRDPFAFTEAVYSFIGQRLVPWSVIKWIDKATGFKETIKPETDYATSDRYGDSFFPPKEHALSSAVNATNWRRYSKYEDVEMIQSMCGGVMGMLGYNALRNEDEIWNYKISTTNNSYIIKI